MNKNRAHLTVRRRNARTQKMLKPRKVVLGRNVLPKFFRSFNKTIPRRIKLKTFELIKSNSKNSVKNAKIISPENIVNAVNVLWIESKKGKLNLVAVSKKIDGMSYASLRRIANETGLVKAKEYNTNSITISTPKTTIPKITSAKGKTKIRNNLIENRIIELTKNNKLSTRDIWKKIAAEFKHDAKTFSLGSKRERQQLTGFKAVDWIIRETRDSSY